MNLLTHHRTNSHWLPDLKPAPQPKKLSMKLLHRSRLLLHGLQLPSAIRCIDGLARLRTGNSAADFLITYRKNGKRLTASVRGRHLASDIQTVLELAAGDCYNLEKVNWSPDVVIDCGGNTGLFTLASSSRWPNAKIICFEPMPENFELIQRHIAINGLENKVDLIQAAVGASKRSARFFIRDANQGSLDDSLDFGSAIDVNVLHLWKVYGSIQTEKVLIKLDVEGAEFEILQDFFQHQPLRQLVMLLEVHGPRERQDWLLAEANKAGMLGRFWERGKETAHLYLASNDVGIVLKTLHRRNGNVYS